ncbi:CHASE domain-containing protein [Rugamonas sp. CCM 8940]|uniref:CHASE domain-containing protein n=1 Tax=Rugamonas sp. CCM 8940 TaxID=2765359 RepID=UPI0018F5DDEA|nr:CHASE domain-containing protein [Rugamonas sp. CCM 8940]MBJ7312696.1 CHASE domain-containing protein [Rugamonas sp. CCM 8940]
MTDHVPRPPRRRLPPDLLSPGLFAGLTLALCLGATWSQWQGARADAERDSRAEFDFRVRELINNIAQRMQTYVQVLYGVQGLYASAEQIDRGEFRSYLAGQEINQHFPGVHGIGYMQLVDGGRLGQHLARLRAEGYADYRVRPEGTRPAYAPIVYLEPFSGSNLLAFGYDALSEPVRRAALEQARDSGLPAMSGKLRLVQEGGLAGAPAQAGFLVLLPVYHNQMPRQSVGQRRAAIRGWVFAPFRVGDVMAGIGGERAALLDVEIYDGEAAAPAALMYHSRPAGAAAVVRRAEEKISIANHRWTVRIAGLAGDDGAGAAGAAKARLLAAGGVLLSVLLAALTWLLARRGANARAALARSRLLTEELEDGQASLLAMAESAQRSQTVLRSILDSTIDGILVDNPGGLVLNSNRRFRALWNVPEHLDWQSDGAALLAHMGAQLVQQGPLLDAAGRLHRDHEEYRDLLRLKDGRVIEQFTRGLHLGNDHARLWSFRDITERTQIEQREQTRRHVLELLATGAPLQTILEAVVLGVEAADQEMLCSVLLLDEEGRRLLVGAAPSLPAFFNAALHGQPLAVAPRGCCQAALGGGRVIVEDIAADPSWGALRELALRAGLGSCWSDPILSAGGEVLGSFAIYHRRAQRPSIANIGLIEQAAHLAGIAIEQARAASALRAGEARFRSLYDNAPVALWEQDWSAVRGALAEPPLAGVRDLARHLRERPAELARLAGLVRILDVNAAALAQVGAPPGGKDVAALGLAQNFAAGAMDGFAAALAALAEGRQLFACEGSFLRLDGVARQNELTLLVMPGHTLSLDFVIVSTLDITERKRMNDELLLLATTDFLTGLPNRREFMARLEDEQARLQRDGNARAAVLMLDIDHFKRVNDEFGHAAGDAVLRHLAELMRDGQRKIDTLGRVGGEEFAVLLPGADLAAAGAFAERLRQRIADSPLQLDGRRLTVTVSVGIGALSGADAGFDAALIRADQALYSAKRGGRNRVELSA